MYVFVLFSGVSTWIRHHTPYQRRAIFAEKKLLVGSHASTFSENAAELGGLPHPLRLFLSTPFRQ